MTIEITNKLVCSSISSRLDYCNSLTAGISEHQLNRIQHLQNNAARLVTKTSKRDHITPILKNLHWLPIRCRIQYRIATTVHQCLNEPSYPEYLKELVTPYVPPRQLRSSSRNNIVKPRTKLKTCGQRAFPYQAATIWNELPLYLKEIESLPIFKKHLKTHLFKQHFY